MALNQLLFGMPSESHVRMLSEKKPVSKPTLLFELLLQVSRILDQQHTPGAHYDRAHLGEAWVSDLLKQISDGAQMFTIKGANIDEPPNQT